MLTDAGPDGMENTEKICGGRCSGSQDQRSEFFKIQKYAASGTGDGYSVPVAKRTETEKRILHSKGHLF